MLFRCLLTADLPHVRCVLTRAGSRSVNWVFTQWNIPHSTSLTFNFTETAVHTLDHAILSGLLTGARQPDMDGNGYEAPWNWRDHHLKEKNFKLMKCLISKLPICLILNYLIMTNSHDYNIQSPESNFVF